MFDFDEHIVSTAQLVCIDTWSSLDDDEHDIAFVCDQHTHIMQSTDRYYRNGCTDHHGHHASHEN